jgi:hypothetical protein
MARQNVAHSSLHERGELSGAVPIGLRFCLCWFAAHSLSASTRAETCIRVATQLHRARQETRFARKASITLTIAFAAETAVRRASASATSGSPGRRRWRYRFATHAIVSSLASRTDPCRPELLRTHIDVRTSDDRADSGMQLLEMGLSDMRWRCREFHERAMRANLKPRRS